MLYMDNNINKVSIMISILYDIAALKTTDVQMLMTFTFNETTDYIKRSASKWVIILICLASGLIHWGIFRLLSEEILFLSRGILLDFTEGWFLYRQDTHRYLAWRVIVLRY